MFLLWLSISLLILWRALSPSLVLSCISNLCTQLKLESSAMFKCHVFERESHHPDVSVSLVPVAFLDSHIRDPMVIYYSSLPGTTESVKKW